LLGGFERHRIGNAFNQHIGICRANPSAIGVLPEIQPWNYPFYQIARFAAPKPMAGKTILLKHAPGFPQCALPFERILAEAGLPAGAYTNLFLSNDQFGKLSQRKSRFWLVCHVYCISKIDSGYFSFAAIPATCLP
jgi:hypothetical protein